MRKLLVCCGLLGSLEAQMIDVSSYGWLDQYSINAYINGYVGDEACVPTASTNALTYLQTVVPAVFGSNLIGTSNYSNWEQADITLIGLMSTAPDTGTYYGPFLYGLIDYVNVLTDYPKVQFQGIFYGGYPIISNTVKSGIPTPKFLSNALGAGSGVLIGISYLNGNGGHELVVNGLQWDASTNTGTLYFVDSLDPSQNYSGSSPAAVLGPVKQTMGTLRLDDRGFLVLDYDQYQGNLSPYNPTDYGHFPATITTALAVGGAPYVPFGQLLPAGNAHALAQGFDAVDPTTAPMFPILAVLNTSSDLSALFNQLDPSLFNSILFTEQTITEQILTGISNNLMQYRHQCYQTDCNPILTYWAAPLAAGIKQCGASGGSYKNTLLGVIGGFDYFFKKDYLVGSGVSYVNGDVRWSSNFAKANLNNYGAFLYGAWFGTPLWIDVSATYAYNRVNAKNEIVGTSLFPLIDPINNEITQRINSNSFSGHVGLIYNLLCTETACSSFDLWPFLNVDAISAHQPNVYQNGGSSFDLTLLKKWSTLLRPNAGLGFSFYSSFKNLNTFVNATLSYAYESRLGGKNTTAYFSAAYPTSAFTLSGSFPNNHLICPAIQAGILTPSDTIRCSLSYRGSFGTDLIANQFSFEFNSLF